MIQCCNYMTDPDTRKVQNYIDPGTYDYNHVSKLQHFLIDLTTACLGSMNDERFYFRLGVGYTASDNNVGTLPFEWSEDYEW